MARPGISKHAVFEAANQIIGRGGEPTIEQVRGILGSGSNSTIAGFLREWRALQANENVIPLSDDVPHEITGLIRGLWQRLLHQSNDKVAAMQASCDKDINEVKAAFNGLTQEYNLLQQQHEQLKIEKHSLQGDKDALEQVVIQKDQSITALRAQNEGLVAQLTESQQHVNELKRLHKQTQENLEHYREASREQRLQEQEKFNQQLQQAEAMIKQLRQENDLLVKDKLGLNYQVEKIAHEKALLQQSQDDAISKLNKLQHDFVELQKDYANAATKATLLETEYEKALQKLERESHDLITLQGQVAVLSEQVNIWKEQVSELREQNKTLVQEKWEIAQEKALLIGQMKQTQAIVG